MPSCKPFDVAFTGSAEDLFDTISTVIQNNGGTISGTPSGGTVSIRLPALGQVAGTFSVSGQTCTIHITKRRFFLPCGTIQSFLRSQVPNLGTATD